MNKVALIILFNHNYEANLSRLDAIYSSRFKNIWYVMPFYQGHRDDVISVYENSYYFQGYIAKALEQIKNNNFEHYIIIGDDLILNPNINENNYRDYFKVDDETAFVPEPFLLNDIKVTKPNRPMAPFWHWALTALNFNLKQPGIECANYLPNYDEALALLKTHGYDFTPEFPIGAYKYNQLLSFSTDKTELGLKTDYLKKFGTKIIKNIIYKKSLQYPLIGSYSDCVVIPHKHVQHIIQYFGITAAMHLFVEIGLPTSIALAVPKIISESAISHKGLTFWLPSEVAEFEARYGNSFKKLQEEYPLNTLYVHPVKLSRWK